MTGPLQGRFANAMVARLHVPLPCAFIVISCFSFLIDWIMASLCRHRQQCKAGKLAAASGMPRRLQEMQPIPDRCKRDSYIEDT